MLRKTVILQLTMLLLGTSSVHGDDFLATSVMAQPAETEPVINSASYRVDLKDLLENEEGIESPVESEHDFEPPVEGEPFVDFPEEQPSLHAAVFEAAPTVLSWPHEPMAHIFERLLHAEHFAPETELEEEPIGLQYVPPRPPLIVEWNDLYLSPGFLEQGIEIPTGAVWRPAFWVFGQYRTAIQYYENNQVNVETGAAIGPAVEWVNRLDLFGQLNLSGTERVLMGLRPFDEEFAGRRDFTGYDFHDGTSLDAWNARFQTLFFEGDFGEIFPRLDLYDTRMLDYGFSVGRMPLLAQQGLLINEDMIDAVTVTRNTLNGLGDLNLRITGLYSWGAINRNSPLFSNLNRMPPSNPLGNGFDPSSRMAAILTESDFRVRTINLDAVYVDGDDRFTGDLLAFGASAIRRRHGYHNTYNTSLHVLASYPTNGRTNFADQGELLFAQTSWTPHHSDDLIYVNGFWAIDQFTSPARGTMMGSPLGQTGILFAAVGLGDYLAPIPNRTNDTAGASVGYQMFFDQTRTQLIWEWGGLTETKGSVDRGAFGTAMSYQKAVGQHYIVRLDGFVVKREGFNLSQGLRSEFLIRF